MHRTRPSQRYQSGVLPYRWHQQQLDVLLITSRQHARWIIPKGMIPPHLSPEEAACREAYEEAGICGTITSEAIGSYPCYKANQVWHVLIYPMAVHTVLDIWPERHERQRCWFPVPVAAQQAAYPELQAVIAVLPSVAGSVLSSSSAALPGAINSGQHP